MPESTHALIQQGFRQGMAKAIAAARVYRIPYTEANTSCGNVNLLHFYTNAISVY